MSLVAQNSFKTFIPKPRLYTISLFDEAHALVTLSTKAGTSYLGTYTELV